MLPAGALPLDYALGGGGGMAPTRLRWVVFGGWLAVAVSLSLVLDTPIAVGLLPTIAIYFAVNKPRGVLLTDHGLASLQCGFFNGRPTQVLGLDGLASLDQRVAVEGTSTRLQVGPDQVWLHNKDLKRFLEVAPRPVRPADPPPGPPSA